MKIDEKFTKNRLIDETINRLIFGKEIFLSFLKWQNNSKSVRIHILLLRGTGGLNASFAFSYVTPQDVFNAFNKIDSNSTGLDGIQLWFINFFIHLILPHITHIFNTSTFSSTLRTAWKVSKVIPIAKISDPLEPKDYRPISILPALSKALDIVMRDQIVGFLDWFQSSFRKCHSTVTALLGVSDDIHRMLDQKMVVALLLLDFSKAFELLCRKLVRFVGFSSSAVRFLKSYLRRRSQCVIVNGVFPNFYRSIKAFRRALYGF
jgi:hypothetical protein